MEKIFLNVNGGRDITFIGQQVAHEHDPEYDVATAVYETEKGNWVITYTTASNDLIRHIVIKNKSQDELIEALGFSDLSKSIYQQLGIDTAQNIDI